MCDTCVQGLQVSTSTLRLSFTSVHRVRSHGPITVITVVSTAVVTAVISKAYYAVIAGSLYRFPSEPNRKVGALMWPSGVLGWRRSVYPTTLVS